VAIPDFQPLMLPLLEALADGKERGVGVATTQVYELKEVSNDFFDEDEG
jgi:hypothetical protein